MPEMSAERLLERIARGKPVPAIVLVGDDPYLRDECRTQIVDAYVPEAARDWAVAHLSAAKSWHEVFQRAQTMPMLASRQVVIVEEVESLEELGDKAREAAVDRLDAYLDDPAPFTVLLLEAARRLDGRQRVYKVLSEKALIVSLAVSSQEATALAVQIAKKLGAQLDRDAAAMLVDILNGEPGRIRVELEKLSLYVLGRGRITPADVQALVISAKIYSVWELADMLAGQHRDSALKFLDNLLREGEQPAGIVGALAWMYRKLLEARELPAHTQSYQAARHLGVRPETAELALRQARKISKAGLLAGIGALAEADSQLKSGIANPRAVMEFLIARLTASETSTAA
ncbi:MAG: DNA polymerase III subunit delta [Candidatus Acidiferrales bacterium]